MGILTAARARAALVALLAPAVLAGGCGGGDGDDGTGPDGGGGAAAVTASIDGKAFASNTPAGLDRATLSAPGLYILVANQTSGTASTSLTMTLYNIRGPGTYPLGVNATTYGGTALLVESARGWSTPLSGVAGTVTLTEVSTTKLVGTFSFTATALSGGATGTRTVTNGRFDLPVQVIGSVGPLPDNYGGRVGATINGTAWNAATIAGGSLTSSGFALTATTDDRSLSFSLFQVTAPGTYALSSSRVIVVTGNGTPTQTWGVSGGTGSVTITTATATRLTGTFNATLPPSAGATGTVTITNGTFDVGRL